MCTSVLVGPHSGKWRKCTAPVARAIWALAHGGAKDIARLYVARQMLRRKGSAYCRRVS